MSGTVDVLATQTFPGTESVMLGDGNSTDLVLALSTQGSIEYCMSRSYTGGRSSSINSPGQTVVGVGVPEEHELCKWCYMTVSWTPDHMGSLHVPQPQ